MPRKRPQVRVIARELLKHSSQKAAAVANGWTEDNISKWARLPGVQKALSESAELSFQEASSKLMHSSGLALAKLQQLMVHPNSPPAIQLAAAKTIMDMALRVSEVRLMRERLTSLEDELAQLQLQPSYPENGHAKTIHLVED